MTAEDFYDRYKHLLMSRLFPRWSVGPDLGINHNRIVCTWFDNNGFGDENLVAGQAELVAKVFGDLPKNTSCFYLEAETGVTTLTIFFNAFAGKLQEEFDVALEKLQLMHELSNE